MFSTAVKLIKLGDELAIDIRDGTATESLDGAVLTIVGAAEFDLWQPIPRELGSVELDFGTRFGERDRESRDPI